MSFSINPFIHFDAYTPLEQFDEVIWLWNQIFEVIEGSIFSISNREFFAEDIYVNGYTGVTSLFSLDSGSGFILIIFVISLVWHFFSVQISFVSTTISDFSPTALLTVIHLFTGTLFSFWFADFFFPRESRNNAGETISIDHIFLPQIDLSFAVDERRITFFLAFFFLGGGESEDEEDFFLSEETDLAFIEEIVAPLFVVNLGKDIQENGALYLKVCSVFSFVLISNLRGRIPYGDTTTSSLILTFWVSFAVFGSLLTLRIRKHGINYFFSLFRPSGCPFPLLFLLIPIEFLSYCFRVISLCVRLFANRRAGHTLRKVIIGFSYIRFTLGEGYAVAGFLPAIVIFILVFLERAVAAIQAYIFTILICIYLKDLYVAH